MRVYVLWSLYCLENVHKFNGRGINWNIYAHIRMTNCR